MSPGLITLFFSIGGFYRFCGELVQALIPGANIDFLLIMC